MYRIFEYIMAFFIKFFTCPINVSSYMLPSIEFDPEPKYEEDNDTYTRGVVFEFLINSKKCMGEVKDILTSSDFDLQYNFSDIKPNYIIFPPNFIDEEGAEDLVQQILTTLEKYGDDENDYFKCVE